MKILIVGFLAFSGWSALSTYYYVCKIKGLCKEPIPVQIDTHVIADDSLNKPKVLEQFEYPKDINIYFAFDKSEFNADANTDQFFNKSKNYLDQNLKASISVTGHTDAVGTDEYNQALGYHRAQAVQHYFESRGMLANRIVIESMGEEQPTDDNNTAAGRATNRRAAITIK